MPRRRVDALFELGPYWIKAEPNRPGFYRHWNDAIAGRTRRARLASTSLEFAKLELAELIVKSVPKSATSYLSIVFEAYLEKVTDRLPSKNPARRAGALILEFLTKESRIKAPVVSDFDEGAQKAFVSWCANAKGHAVKTISRNLSVAAAALSYAKIEDPTISYDPCDVVDTLEETGANIKTAQCRFMPNDEEFARFLDNTDGRLFRACIIMLLTACRPKAALDLSPAQRNREAGLLLLNPKERRQTTKWRPIVREPKCLTQWLDAWEAERCDQTRNDPYVGFTSVDSLQSAIVRARAVGKANLPHMVAYSIRHKATTILRRYEVPSEQISMQLGHKRPDLRTTNLYGEFEPTYLKQSSDSLDHYLSQLQRFTQRCLINSRRNPANKHSAVKRLG